MNLLECLVGITLCVLLLNPLLKTSADLLIKQIEYEKTQTLISEAERALELIGRGIRMAGYQNVKSIQHIPNKKNTNSPIEIGKRSGYQGSDTLVLRYELSDGVDFDCIGNVLTSDRTKHNLVLQGFQVDRQAGLSKGIKVNGGSLMGQRAFRVQIEMTDGISIQKEFERTFTTRNLP